MRTSDGTDVEVLRHVTDDARRPYRRRSRRRPRLPVGVRPRRPAPSHGNHPPIRSRSRPPKPRDVPVLVELSVRPDLVGGPVIRSRLRMASSTCSRPLTRAFSPSRVSRRRTFGRSRRTRSIQRSWRRLPKAITDYEVVVLRSADWTPHVSGTDLGGTCARCGNEVNGEGETPRLDGSLYSLRRPSRREQFEAPYDRSSADARPSRRRWRCPGPFSSGYPPLYSRSPVSSFPPPCSRS